MGGLDGVSGRKDAGCWDTPGGHGGGRGRHSPENSRELPGKCGGGAVSCPSRPSPECHSSGLCWFLCHLSVWKALFPRQAASGKPWEPRGLDLGLQAVRAERVRGAEVMGHLGPKRKPRRKEGNSAGREGSHCSAPTLQALSRPFPAAPREAATCRKEPCPRGERWGRRPPPRAGCHRAPSLGG